MVFANKKIFVVSVSLLFFVVLLAIPARILADVGLPVPVDPPTFPLGAGDTRVIIDMAEDHFSYLPVVIHRSPPVPYAPELAPIFVPGLWEPYTLTWSIDLSKIPVSHYVIQVSDNVNFTNAIEYTSTITEYTVTDRSYKTYYYRVRGDNSWGAGIWSNVEPMQFLSYQDDFNDARTSWAPRRTSSPDLSLMKLNYAGYELETLVADMFDFAIFSPMVTAPPKPYRIRLMSKVLHKVNEVSYGIAFGGNGGTFCDVARDTAQDPNGCFSHYYRLNVIWAGGYLKYNFSRVDGHGDRGQGISQELRGFANVENRDPADWQTWDIWVYEDRFALSLNEKFIAWFYDTTYLSEPYFGIFSSTYEYNNAHFLHTLYYVEPITEDLDPPYLP